MRVARSTDFPPAMSLNSVVRGLTYIFFVIWNFCFSSVYGKADLESFDSQRRSRWRFILRFQVEHIGRWLASNEEESGER
jgi:hypothetical protein